eukprot:GHRQ01030859.1.p1 GENE.GHRQ01030859.1~~GHRQ01030859.1.p1  ORF type:complete len:114 (-),score=3.38 GHRQ01030859.1:650-991(-)
MTPTLLRNCCHSKASLGRRAVSVTRSKRALHVCATSYDPENLFAGSAPRQGIIERRLMSKQMETDKEFAKAVSMARDDDQKKVMLRRQSRQPPTDHVELVEYFLNTQADDMEV